MEGSSNPKLVASIIDERRKRLQSMKAAGRSHEIISLIGVDRKPSDKSGLLDENKKGPTSHILARAIVLGYIVKMTSLQDAALPENVELENIPVSGALDGVRSLLKDYSNTFLDHIFNVFPSEEDEEEVEVDLRCTTFDLWAGPRLISAAAVLSVRCCGLENVKSTLNDDQDQESEARQRLIKLRETIMETLFTILAHSIRAVSQTDNVQALLTELIRTSFQALLLDEHAAAFPQLKPWQVPSTLLPRQPRGSTTQEESKPELTFFKSNQLPPSTKLSSRKGRPPAVGDGISRCWLPEDHTSFTPLLATDPSITPKMLHTFHYSLFLSVVSLALSLGKEFPLELSHLSDLALKLFISSWRSDLVANRGLLPQRPLPEHLQTQRLEIVTRVFSSLANPSPDKQGPFHPYSVPSSAARELSELAVETLSEYLQGEEEVSQSATKVLRSTLSALRGIGNPNSPAVQEASSRLNLLSNRLIVEMQKPLPFEEGVASGAGLTSEEKASRDSELLRKSCAFEALLLLFESFPTNISPITSSQEQALRSLLLEAEPSEDLDEGGTLQMAAGASWISVSDKLALQASLSHIRESFIPRLQDSSNLKRRLDGEQGRTQFALQTQTQFPSSKRKRIASTAQRAASSAAVLRWAQVEDEQTLNARCADPNESNRVLPLRARAKMFCSRAGSLRITQEIGGDEVVPKGTSFQCDVCDALPSSSSTIPPLVLSETADDQVGAIQKKCRNVLSVLPRCSSALAVALLDDFRCHLVHASEAESECCLVLPGSSSTDSLLRSALQHSSRSVRMAAGRLAHMVARKQCELYADGSRQIAPLQNRVAGLLTAYRVTTVDQPQLLETTIIGLGLLGTIHREEILRHVLQLLILQLGGNILIKPLAYCQIAQLSTFYKVTNYQLLSPYLDTLSCQVVERMISSPNIFFEILALTSQKSDGFLLATLTHTLPHFIILQNDPAKAQLGGKILGLIASGTGNSSVGTTCMKHPAAILKEIFALAPKERNRSLETFERCISEDGSVRLNSVVRTCEGELLGHLIVQLGNPRVTAAQAAEEGLHYLQSLVGPSENGRNRKVAKEEALRTYLRQEILQILTWINDELMSAHGKKSLSQKAMAARSVGALIERVGSSISDVTPQIMATLNSTLSVNELMLATLQSWRKFIFNLRFVEIVPVIGQTGAALLAAWPRFGPAEKKEAAAILKYIVIDSETELRGHISALPSLEALSKDIPEICARLRTVRGNWGAEQVLKNLLSRVASEHAAICLQSLHDLKAFLLQRRDYMFSITSGSVFDGLVGEMVSVLFSTATRTDDQHAEMRDLCFECMGVLGAVDPDRFEQPSEEPIRPLLHNFEDEDEAVELAVRLVSDLLVSSFRATDDTKHQAALAFAIQELLKFCGFTPSLVHQTGISPPSVKAKARWSNLPKAVVDTVAPLLNSKYSVEHGQPTSRSHPVYNHTDSFRDWIQSWATQLILAVKGERAKTLFGTLRAVIRGDDLTIAQYILPHLVLNIMISGPTRDQQMISQEFQAVLEDQVQPTSGFDAERKLLTAQTIFRLMDHLSSWIRRKRVEMSRSRKSRDYSVSDESLVQVESIMASISQERMAKASLQCRAYARSLLTFEQSIRELKSSGAKQDSDLQSYYEDMHKIYASLDEPDGMEGISTLVFAPSLEHQIREHESTGRWTAAQSCWEVELQKQPEDVNLHLGLLRCLRNLGHYDTMRTHIRGVLSLNPEWEALLAPFQVEGACILSDWEDVALALAFPGEQSSEHAIARALLAMRREDPAEFNLALREARHQLGKPIVAAGKTSYTRVYDSVMQLHMLHELDMIRSVARASDSSQLRELNQSLLSRLNSTLPSFRTREPILSLRRSAFSAHESNPALRAEIGQAWIATSKIARRAGHIQTAYSAVLQSSQCQAPFAFVQRAKILATEDQGQAAIQELNHSLQAIHIARSKQANIVIDLTNAEEKDLDKLAYARATLVRARLVEASARFENNEVIARYKESAELDPNSEKNWYYYGRFYDTREMNADPVSRLATGYRVCRYYIRSAHFGTKFFYRTLPRALTIWFDAAEDAVVLKHQGKESKDLKAVDESTKTRLSTFQKLNEIIMRATRKLAPYQWLAVFPQLVSRILHKNNDVWKQLKEIISIVLVAHSDQAIWGMVAALQSRDSHRSSKAKEIVNKVKAEAGEKDISKRKIDATQRLADQLLKLCNYEIRGNIKTLSLSVVGPALLELGRHQIMLPLQSSINVTLPANGIISNHHRPFSSDLPYITGFDDTIDIMASLQKPRKLTIHGNDGKKYPFLCKPNDDLRKDARLMDFDSIINKVLQSDSESRRRKLLVRTYAVVTLNEECGLIEWVPNTVGLRPILARLYGSRTPLIPLYAPELRVFMDEGRSKPKEAGKIFEEKVLSRYPPVFHEWFLNTWPEPSAWLKARTAYARTLAVMSMVGHVLGLGDRHGENILFDSVSGDTVHVDLNCIFEKGKTFEIPERVPFRLTRNMIDAMGVTGYEGVFRRTAEIALRILRENKDSLVSVLEAMVHDPLVEWGADNRGRKGGPKISDRPDPRILEARKALDPVAQKLDGYLRTGDGSSRHSSTSQIYTTNHLVDLLIREASSNTNLAQMYIGWAPYL